jgi:anti-sigma-K factor RskA
MRAQPHQLHLLTGSYALDALTGTELAEFDKHLARCDSCAQEVRGFRETAARLAVATAVTPPPRMRQRVLAAAPRMRQLAPPGRHLLALAGQRGLRQRRYPSLAGVTAGILALAAAVVLLLVTQAGTRSQLHQAQAANRAIAAVLAAPDARIASVPATLGGTVTAVTSLREHEAVVTTANMPMLPDDKVYQLWVMRSSGTARSAGLLTTARPGSTVPLLATGVLPGDQLGITVEPAGGTNRPTTTPVAVMPVPA